MIPLFKVLMSYDAGQNVNEVLNSGNLTQGKFASQFEKELSDSFGTKVLLTNSCTSAIDLSLHLCDVQPGDEVITTPLTCTATNCGIVNRKAVPIWADINEVNGKISIDSVFENITKKTKAIIVVSWAGSPVDCDGIRKNLPREIPIIEDAAHAFMAPYSGDYVCWSFQAIKHLTCGDGGALKVPEKQYKRARLLRWFGLDRDSDKSFRCKQNINELGYKYHMNDISASIGLSNLTIAKEAVKKHRENAHYYISSLGKCRKIYVPCQNENSSWWLFMIITEKRDEFIQFMKDKGIECSPTHTRNDHQQAFLKVARNSDLPGTNYYASRHVAVPVGWWLSDRHKRNIVKALIEWDSML